METSVGMVTARRRLLRPSTSAHMSEDWCWLGSSAKVWSGLSRTAAVCSVVYRLIFSASDSLGPRARSSISGLGDTQETTSPDEGLINSPLERDWYIGVL
ncbi:unnamed protein product [Gadus morhua 'NCC']